jgi:hypothetical protein
VKAKAMEKKDATINNNTNDNNYMPYNRRGTHVDDDDESVHEKKLVN